MKVRIDRKNIPLMLCLPLAFCFQSQETPEAEAFTVKQASLDVPINEPIPVFVTKKTVDLSYLKEAKVGGLLSAYIGKSGKLPHKAEIDFRDQMKYLWDKKLEIEGVSPATKKAADRIVSEYSNSDPQYKSIKVFIDGISQQSMFAHSALDYSKYCKRLRLTTVKCHSLQKIASRITGQQLAAYGMTELFPSHSGKFNYVLLDTILRNAGENYIQNIPALGDTYLSKGFYQWTAFAVRHDKNVEGASVVNLYVDKTAKIAGSVISLTNEQQHRAAFMFSVYNISRLLQHLGDREVATLANQCKSDELTQFIATAHHLPTPSIKKAVVWIKHGCKNKYKSYLGPSLREYATKTKNNLDELERRI